MHTGKGQIIELILEDGYRYVQIGCPENLIPAPGQYLLVGDTSDEPLPVPIFYTDFAPQGFIATASDYWKPGDVLSLRGPLGRGFTVPVTARKIALIAFDDSPACLRGLIQPALRRDASVVLLCASHMDKLPDQVEVQPLAAMDEIAKWADYIAVDVMRENLPALKERLNGRNQLLALRESQVLIHTQMPCGAVADCGVCAVTTTSTWKLACKDGPVFDLSEI